MVRSSGSLERIQRVAVSHLCLVLLGSVLGLRVRPPDASGGEKVSKELACGDPPPPGKQNKTKPEKLSF